MIALRAKRKEKQIYLSTCSWDLYTTHALSIAFYNKSSTKQRNSFVSKMWVVAKNLFTGLKISACHIKMFYTDASIWRTCICCLQYHELCSVRIAPVWYSLGSYNSEWNKPISSLKNTTENNQIHYNKWLSNSLVQFVLFQKSSSSIVSVLTTTPSASAVPRISDSRLPMFVNNSVRWWI